MNVIISDKVKSQLKRYHIEEEEFLRVVAIDKLIYDESSVKHNIIYPIEIDWRKYVVYAKKQNDTITIKSIEKNHFAI